MSEKVEKLFEAVKDFSVEKQPQVRSLLLSRIATHQEAVHNTDVASQTWMINEKFLQEIIAQNPEEAFNFGVSLVTLSVSKDDSTEIYLSYLRGNGLNILIDEQLHDRLTQYLNKGNERVKLKKKVEEFLNLDVKGWDKKKVYSTPDSFNLLTSLILGVSLADSPEQSVGRAFFEKAQKQLNNSDVLKVVGYFKELPDTNTLAGKLDSYLAPKA